MAEKFGIIIEERKRKSMNSKSLRKRLEKLDYTLGQDIFGWIVISTLTGFEWKFSTLGGVKRFIVDEENMKKWRLAGYNG